MYEANAALRHALGVALPALRHDQIEAAVVRLVDHPDFTNALILALEKADWEVEEAIAIAADIKDALR